MPKKKSIRGIWWIACLDCQQHGVKNCIGRCKGGTRQIRDHKLGCFYGLLRDELNKDEEVK